MSKISLTNLVNLQNETTAVTAINSNNGALTTAFDNTLSRNGTTPNTMGASLDMNSNRILNLLPAAATSEPATLAQLNAVSVLHGNVPAGGTTGQFLSKTNNTDYVTQWASNSVIYVNVKDYGAKVDGVTDDLIAINAALAANDVVFIPAGVCKVSGPILMSRTAQRLIGAGRNFTRIIGSSVSGAVISIPGGTSYIEIGHLTVDRSAVPDSTGHGIQQNTIISQGVIHDVEVLNQYFGIVVTGSSYGSISNLVVHDNYSHGLFIVGSVAGQGICQWNLDNILSSVNNGDGIRVSSFDNTNITLGEPWRNITTFANSGYGISLLGTGSFAVADFILNGAFLGSDGLGELYMDTFTTGGAVPAVISNVQIEATGNNSTGRGTSTPASHSANGIQITANNPAVNLVNISINGPANDGILSAATLTTISNSTIVNCGVAGTGNRNGIEITAGSAIITNVSTGNDSTSTQQNGIVLGASSTKNIVTNNNVSYKSGSVVAGIVNNSSTPATNIITNNVGTGTGGTVTQVTSRSTAVTLNKQTGAITLFSAAGSATATTFTVNNSYVAATDVILISQKSGTDKYETFVTAVTAGTFNVTFFTTGGTTTEQPVFNFTVMKAFAT